MTAFLSALCLMTIALARPEAQAGGLKRQDPAEFTLVNKAKDIHVVSDRDESILDFFGRTRILLGEVLDKSAVPAESDLEKLLQAKEVLTKFWVSYPSKNDDPQGPAFYGAWIKVAPPSAAVLKLFNDHKPDGKDGHVRVVTLILRPDEKVPDMYRVIGFTERHSLWFFGADTVVGRPESEKKNATDGFSQKDLSFKGEPKK